MNENKTGFLRASRAVAFLVVMSLLAPFIAGCSGGGRNEANLPPIDDTRSASYRTEQPAPKQGMSTSKKVAILAGAAALYYLYKRSQNKKEAGERQYYLSKNGRVYYRDENKRVHWVTQAPAAMEVPEEELRQYPELSRYRGYNNQTTGVDFGNLFSGSQ